MKPFGYALVVSQLLTPSLATALEPAASAISAAPPVHGDIPEPVNISHNEVKRLLKQAGYRRVKIIEVDYEWFQGKKVYEVDFKYRGKVYEAAISLSKKLLYVELEVDD